LLRDYGTLLRSPVFSGFAFGGGCSTTAFYAFLAAGPFVFADQLHRPTTELGFYLALLVVGVSVGNFSAARLARRFSGDTVLMGANLLSLASAVTLLSVAVAGYLSVASVMGAMFLFMVGAGAVGPIALARAISVDPRLTGSAAGLYGFAQMSVGALCTAMVSLGTDPAIASGVVLTLMAVVARINFTVANRRSARAG